MSFEENALHKAVSKDLYKIIQDKAFTYCLTRKQSNASVEKYLKMGHSKSIRRTYREAYLQCLKDNNLL